ncbi:sporulation membrane protein YtaF [Fodinisporobacter ferrooxydans]|uniref:Sporulation membrane protein YtaF n=1 Tax=Fodinisporobacter ferrooxydans TaxID=2901836 RepID=A0ABY4CPY8_9BACL|nr:sporulation membrane protein YtaF [Alicyclobacillaceae bacterium MYW30-H2]
MAFATWLTILGLALSSSIDNFGVGISYGVSKIRIGFLPNMIISVIAFLFSVIGILFGKYVAKMIPGMFSNIVAAVFLFIVSVRIIMITLSAKKRDSAVPKQPRKKKSKLSFASDYLKEPEKADFDHSGEISIMESIVLGVAVSMNALTNGLGAGMLGLPPLAISIVSAIFSFLAIWWGVAAGNKVANIRIGSLNIGQFSTAISGIILFITGIHILFTS